MNILILSAGTRNKIVQYFKKELGEDGRVIATDCSDLAPAIYEADAHYIVPRISDSNYIDRILDICKKENINGVFSLIDPELSLIAKHRDEFEEIGVTPIVSSYELCETSLDKYKMSDMLSKLGIENPKCYLDPEIFFKAMEEGEISYPCFVKPIKGSASININRVTRDEEVKTLFHTYKDVMVQEFMDCDEYGADVYVDMISGKCTGIFLKKKIKMRAGETDKSISVKSQSGFKLIKSFVEEVGYTGMIDIDLFRDGDRWYISEVNPRFGGGYPHAYECGVNFAKNVIDNLNGNETTESIGDYEEGIYMMKYNEIMIRKEE